MSIGRKLILMFTLMATTLGIAGEAYAARLFKGIAVITARSNTPQCVLEYDIAESFIVEYYANIGSETNTERLAIIGSNGSFLLTNIDPTPTLRGVGRVSVTGNAFATSVNIPSINTSFAITAVAANTLYVNMNGVAHNLGFPGCSVYFRAALTVLPPGGY